MDIDRPQLYIFYLPVTIVSLVIYIQILVEIYRKRKNIMYDSLFFRLICSQSIYDISYVIMYFAMELPQDWKALTPFFLAMNGTIIPHLIYAHLFLCFIAQIIGVTIMAFSRMLLVCHPTRKVTKVLKRLTTGQVVLVHFIIPALYARQNTRNSLLNSLLILNFVHRSTVHVFSYVLLGQSWRYYGSLNGRMVRMGSAESITINSVVLCVVGLSGSILSAVCYIRISLTLRKRPFRMWRSELHIFATSFVLFCALCTLTAYFVVSLYTLLFNMSLYFPIRKHFYAFTYFLSLANPWCLIISSASMRSSVLRRILPFCCTRLRQIVSLKSQQNSVIQCTTLPHQAVSTI